MAKTTEVSMFDQLELDAEAKRKVKALEGEQLALEKENESLLSSYERDVLATIQGKGKQKADVKERLDLLDKGIERGHLFKKEISELAESLTGQLQDLGQLFGDMSNYQGIERFIVKVPIIGTRFADKRRLSRVKSADVKESLQTILDYGHHMVGKLYSAIIENMQCQTRISTVADKTALTLKENEPVYQRWREEREKLQRDTKTLDDKLDAATAGEAAKLETDKNELQKELGKAQINENHYFTLVDKAKSALPVQRTHLKAYKDMVDALTQLRTGLEQSINHVTELYLATPTAIKTALSTKAASQYDKGMKFATDKATDTVLRSVQGVLDETASRAERPLIEPERLDMYRKLQREMRAQFDKRIADLKDNYARPRAS